jgi:hypothetical protein
MSQPISEDEQVIDWIIRETIVDGGLVNPRAARKLCLAHISSAEWQWKHGPFKCICTKKCECGVDKTGGGIHSDWCPKSCLS